MADLSLNFTAAALGTDAYGDLLMANGDLVLTNDTVQGAADGNDPVSQAVAQNCRTLLNEYFLDTSLGVPYYQELFGQKTDTVGFEAALQNVVLSTPGITGLISWKLDSQPRLRRLVLTFRALTTNGEVIWSGSVNPTVGGGL